MELKLKTVILECREIDRLADFYSRFLGWPIVFREEGFLRLQPPDSDMGIAVQYAEDYIPPIWPSQNGRQQMMAHLDFGVDSRQAVKEQADRAVALGAKPAAAQYGGEDWVTLLDPAGHPFCIVFWG